MQPIDDAASELYQQAAAEYGRALERLARAWERDPDLQLDLLQDIHLALWQSFGKYEGRCSVRTWVYRVAHNTAASHVVRERRKIRADWVDLEEGLADSSKEWDRTDRKLALEKLMSLLHRLRPVDRQLMLLYLEDLDAAAIGEVLGISAGNVRVRLHRVRKILADLFTGGDA